jgi:hypothetical protein
MYYDKNTFVSEAAALEFYLTKTDGAQRTELLGVSRIHYSSKIAARSWYNDLKSKLTSSTGPAADELRSIYSIMVYE